MTLRLIEATVPQDELERLPVLTKEIPLVQSWTLPADGDLSLVRILLDAQYSEPLSDALMRTWGSRPGFRLVALPVEATIPSAGEDSPEVEKKKIEGIARRVSRDELYEDMSEGSRVTRVYITTVALSTVVASVGLIRGDVAIIIGAMVIAPLLGPNVALSLAATLGHQDLARRSLKAIGVGILTAGGISLALGALLRMQPPLSNELLARTSADFADMALALCAGAAGALAFTSGLPAVLVGVMVAVALLPPLVTAGLLAGAGYFGPAGGAMTLVLTNVTCVNLAAVATFLLQKVRPRTWWEAEKAKKAARLAMAVWVIMLGIIAALIFFGQVELQ